MDRDEWDRAMQASAVLLEAEALWSRRKEGRFLEAQALRLFEKAAALGAADIHARLAELCRYDDQPRAIRWLTDGAAKGELPCLLELARAYSGCGPWSAVAIDMKESRGYWRAWFDNNISRPDGGFPMYSHIAEYVHVLRQTKIEQADVQTLAAVQVHYELHGDSSQLQAVASLIASLFHSKVN